MPMITEQNPYSGAGPVTGKVLIVCPVTLINVGGLRGMFDLILILVFAPELEKRILQMVCEFSTIVSFCSKFYD